MKKCTKCRLEKPETEFGKATANKDRLRCECKSCMKIYRIKNATKIKESRIKFYTESFDKYKAGQIKHNKLNKSKKIAYNKKHKNYYNKYSDNHRLNNMQYYSDRQKYYRETLHPEYLKNCLENQGIPRKTINEYPILMELQKIKILTKRTITKQTN